MVEKHLIGFLPCCWHRRGLRRPHWWSCAESPAFETLRSAQRSVPVAVGPFAMQLRSSRCVSQHRTRIGRTDPTQNLLRVHEANRPGGVLREAP
jgi:hypothetical protein